MRGRIFLGILILMGSAVAPHGPSHARFCHLCLLEDPFLGCLTGSDMCIPDNKGQCMVINIYNGSKLTYVVRGCGEHSSFRCKEVQNGFILYYWFRAECCQYDYCNAWFQPQLQGPIPGTPLPEGPLSLAQIQQFYVVLNLSLPLPAPAPGEPEDTDLPPPTLNLNLPVEHLHILCESFIKDGLLILPQTEP
ncbi:lymphocyte antigen 6 complex locus protein G5b-like isoform X1 [Vombatus ursinus]|uniref:UPAR/Ly6 domain-containing protein n=2 Tax=Vombatus ursinus TaxID=29139 RepID=A0A4X2JTX9_VOMUR|nr:lymphocyte antigen 6 complex locus protein G5b-like isoform X1 [Vombatus ursinus]